MTYDVQLTETFQKSIKDLKFHISFSVFFYLSDTTYLPGAGLPEAGSR